MISKRLEKEVNEEIPLLLARVDELMLETKFLKKKLKNRNEELEMLEEIQFKPSVKDVFDRLVKEKSNEVKSFKDELSRKRIELESKRETLHMKDKEITNLIKELDTKAVRVLELEEEVEKLRQTFEEQEDELNKKLIEATAAAVSHEKYLEELEVGIITIRILDPFSLLLSVHII